MEEPYLYQKIASEIRQEILSGKLKPGDRLPSVRKMTARWNCTIGTIQHAYQELAQQGLVTSRAGTGTKVVEKPASPADTPIRRAALVHRAEAFLLETLASGYTPADLEQAVSQALDRWRTEAQTFPDEQQSALSFCGSHDLAISWIANHFSEIVPDGRLQLYFRGSMGGLMALSEGKADLAGIHLWDAQTQSYNAPYIQRLLPGKRIALIHLAKRRIGWILPTGNPLDIRTLGDITRPGLRFVNRQAGSGTRIWLDSSLAKAGITSSKIQGYDFVKHTHLEIAQSVAEKQADIGIGLEGAARSYGLDFAPLTSEPYELVVPEETFRTSDFQALLDWLRQEDNKTIIRALGGYDTNQTGSVSWIE